MKEWFQEPRQTTGSSSWSLFVGSRSLRDLFVLSTIFSDSFHAKGRNELGDPSRPQSLTSREQGGVPFFRRYKEEGKVRTPVSSTYEGPLRSQDDHSHLGDVSTLPINRFLSPPCPDLLFDRLPRVSYPVRCDYSRRSTTTTEAKSLQQTKRPRRSCFMTLDARTCRVQIIECQDLRPLDSSSTSVPTKEDSGRPSETRSGERTKGHRRLQETDHLS